VNQIYSQNSGKDVAHIETSLFQMTDSTLKDEVEKLRAEVSELKEQLKKSNYAKFSRERIPIMSSV
jgi:hypothetical protein